MKSSNDPLLTVLDSSPLPTPIGAPTFLSEHYVNPGQILEPLRPTPPPLDGYSTHDEHPRYFQSPVHATSHPSDPSASRSPHPSHPSLPGSATQRRRRGDPKRPRKQTKPSPSPIEPGITRVLAGHFFCTHPGCDKQSQAFKRQEHLKRHLLTHTQPRDVGCPFCPKRFQENRKDNLKAHLALHAKPNVERKRTVFNPEAAVVLARMGAGKRGEGDISEVCEQVKRERK